MPPDFGLIFELGTALGTALRKEVVEHREVAGAPAYPRMLAVGGNLAVRPLTVDDVTIAEAIAPARCPRSSARRRPCSPSGAAWSRRARPIFRAHTLATS